VNVTVNNAVAIIDVVQTFHNDKDHPLEVTLKFPIEQEYALGRLTIEINDDIIEGKILKKEKAQEKYEDAIASGHTAVMAEEDKDEPDMVNLKVGNLLAGTKKLLVRFRLLHVLRVECGAYVVRVPMSFFPASEADYAYTFRTVI
jgi:Ca-activated chloride channel family protein